MYQKSIYMTDNTIRAIIFDYNGVVTALGKHDPLIKEYAARCSVPQAVLDKVVREKWALARVGTIDSMEFWGAIAEVLGYETKLLRREWIDNFPVREGVLKLADELLKRGYKTALLTNEIKDWMDEVIPQHFLGRYFESIVTSYEVGVAKPDERMFDAVLEKLELTASSCIYIDDQAKNIIPAAGFGFKTILFDSEEQLRRELKGYGVLLD